MLVYCGKGIFHDEDPYSNSPSTERILQVLMQPYLGKGHILYTDNYYTNPAVADFFINNRTHLCGTVKVDRKNYAKELVDVQLEKGTAAFYKPVSGTPMLVCKYRADKDQKQKTPKIVHMLSTCHQATMEGIGWRNEGVEVMKPTMVKAYNVGMGSVDHGDQQLHNLRTVRKTYKWYKKLAIRFISHDVPINETVTWLTGRHFPSLKEASEGAKDKLPSKQCWVCDARGLRATKGGKL